MGKHFLCFYNKNMHPLKYNLSVNDVSLMAAKQLSFHFQRYILRIINSASDVGVLLLFLPPHLTFISFWCNVTVITVIVVYQWFNHGKLT